MSRQILTVIVEERSEPTRMDFIREASQYPAHYLGFLDETSKNDKTPGRRRGRARKGKRAVKRPKLVRGRRVTGTGFLTCEGMLACKVAEGSMHRDQYLEFLEHQVVCLVLLSCVPQIFLIHFVSAPPLLSISWPPLCTRHGQCFHHGECRGQIDMHR
jgi:hypothetical protein